MRELPESGQQLSDRLFRRVFVAAQVLQDPRHSPVETKAEMLCSSIVEKTDGAKTPSLEKTDGDLGTDEAEQGRHHVQGDDVISKFRSVAC